jgi:hypothetical protein
VNSFLGGAVGFGSDVPDYGSIGPGYTGDYFGSSPTGGTPGGSFLQDLGRGILGGLSSLGSSPAGYGAAPTSAGGGYTDQTKQNMRDLLAMALRSFPTPRSVI